MWQMLLIAGTVFRLAAGMEPVPPELEGCATFNEWLERKKPSRLFHRQEEVDAKLLQTWQFYLKRDPDVTFIELPEVMSILAHLPDTVRNFPPSAEQRVERAFKSAISAIDRKPVMVPLWMKILQTSDTYAVIMEQLPQSVQLRQGSTSIRRSFEGIYAFATESTNNPIPVMAWHFSYLGRCFPLDFKIDLDMPWERSLYREIDTWAGWLPPAALRHARLTSLQALAEIGPAARAAIPLLQEQLQANDEELALTAAVALWRVNQSPDAKTVIQQLGMDNFCLKERLRVLLPDLFADEEWARQRREEEHYFFLEPDRIP